MKKIIVLVLLLCAATLSGTAMAQEDILYERWAGDGSPDDLLTYTETPDYTEFLTSLEYPQTDPDVDDYRSRMTAVLVPPVTGNYTFWILADNDSVLWLSTDEDPANAVELCRESTWAPGWDAWEDDGESESDPVALVGGNRYWLRVGHSEDGGGDYIRIGWGSTDAGIADHTVITDEYIGGSETARNPTPSSGATNVPITVVLGWDPPMDFTPLAYDVYISITDPNANKPKDQVVNHVNQTTYDDPCDLAYNTKYWWRVNAYDPCDVILSPGGVWNFTTWPVEPVFTTEPKGATVEVGSSAQFYVETPRSNTFQWYKEPATALNDGDDGGDVSVVTDADSSTLTISNVELGDEGYYYCVATGTGSTESNHARLLTKRLMGYWNFNGDLNDSVAGNNGTLVDPNVLNPPPGAPVFNAGIPGGGGAINLTEFEIYVEIPNQEYFNFFPQGCTVSCWAKAGSENADWQGLVSKMGGEELPPASWALEKAGSVGYTWFAGNEAYGTTVINDEEWHHLALVYDADADTLTLYVDGEVEGTATGVDLSSRTPTDAPLRIGTYGPYIGDTGVSEGWGFYGWMDNVMIANYPWDGYEVATEYTDHGGDPVCVEPVPGDQNDDCVINTADLGEAASSWLRCNYVPEVACD